MAFLKLIAKYASRLTAAKKTGWFIVISVMIVSMRVAMEFRNLIKIWNLFVILANTLLYVG
jgi:hypothetical protein